MHKYQKQIEKNTLQTINSVVLTQRINKQDKKKEIIQIDVTNKNTDNPSQQVIFALRD